MSLIQMSFTYDTSKTLSGSMSIIGGCLFVLIVLEVIKGLYVEDEAGHMQHHTINGNIY